MKDCASIAVHVTPRSSKDEVLGIRMGDDGLREVSVRVTAPPDGGKANAAVCKMLAKQLGVSKSSVVVKRGETSRHKLIEVSASQEVVESWLESLNPL